MLNQIAIAGRLTAAPELRTTLSGVAVTSFTVAVDRDYRNGDEKQTDFFTVTCWRGSAEYAVKYGDKGRMVVVQGTMEGRKYTDKDGNNRTAWEIQARNVYFVDNRRDGNATAGGDTVITTTPSFSDMSDEELDEILPF